MHWSSSAQLAIPEWRYWPLHPVIALKSLSHLVANNLWKGPPSIFNPHIGQEHELTHDTAVHFGGTDVAINCPPSQIQCPRTVMVKRDNRGCCKISCKRKSMILVAMPHHQRNSRPHLESIVKYGDGRHFQPVLFSPEPCNLSKRPRADINVSFHLSTVEHSNAKANVHFHFCPSGNGRQGNKTFFTRCVLHVWHCDIFYLLCISLKSEGGAFISIFFKRNILQNVFHFCGVLFLEASSNFHSLGHPRMAFWIF